MQNKTKYYLQFTLLCIGTFVLSYGISQIQNKYFNTPHFWIPVFFFGITSLAINVLLTKANTSSKDFVFKTLAISMARLLICMVFVFVYSLFNKEDLLAFTCHFMIQYLIFTIFEVSFLLKYIKQAN